MDGEWREVDDAPAALGRTFELFDEHRYAGSARWPFMTGDGDGRHLLPADLPSPPLMYSLRARKALG